MEVISVRPLANPTSSHSLIGYPDSAAILFVHNRETNHLGQIIPFVFNISPLWGRRLSNRISLALSALQELA
ncbi:hypothetical protein J6590_099925, partial [Homalodisca vitripennis]